MSRKTLLLSIAAFVVVVVVAGVGFVACQVIQALFHDPLFDAYQEHCQQCHGENLEGSPLGTPLVGRPFAHGDSVAEIETSIREGFPTRGMPGWGDVLDPAQVQGLAILVSERRHDYARTDFKIEAPLSIPEGTISSERHDFRIEPVASGLHPRPFSIAPLPDGRILLTEKVLGLRVVSPDGTQSPLVEGTPPTHDDGPELFSLVYGLGWMMDVALHPDYEHNGWIYLHFGDRCRECETSMNKLIRGRIQHGRWVDEQTIWSADPATYTAASDMGAGGRVCFDDAGHVFLSVGIKGPANFVGVQDLGQPYGKIHRVFDDGRVPDDNPFIGVPGALASTWTYGHRSPQGLEFDPETRRLWGTEMGPRGGDEVNLLRAGRNYGWPLYSKGMDYDGTPVEYGKELGIELDLDAIEQPVVDLTPAPAVSSFVVYRGDAFPRWKGDLIVGTLKATELYRMVLEGDRVVQRETLIRGLARIRDIEVAPDGTILLLLEHASGGRIVRLVPVE